MGSQYEKCCLPARWISGIICTRVRYYINGSRMVTRNHARWKVPRLWRWTHSTGPNSNQETNQDANRSSSSIGGRRRGSSRIRDRRRVSFRRIGLLLRCFSGIRDRQRVSFRMGLLLRCFYGIRDRRRVSFKIGGRASRAKGKEDSLSQSMSMNVIIKVDCGKRVYLFSEASTLSPDIVDGLRNLA